jgi:hypothetical protein
VLDSMYANHMSVQMTGNDKGGRNCVDEVHKECYQVMFCSFIC